MSTSSLSTPSAAPFASMAQSPFSDVDSPILLVQEAGTLRDSRQLLLSSIHPDIRVAEDSAEVFSCLPNSSFRLIAIDLRDVRTAERLAFYARRRWPRARILLLGKSSGDIQDSLYDEIVDPCLNPVGLLEICRNLLKGSLRASQSRRS